MEETGLYRGFEYSDVGSMNRGFSPLCMDVVVYQKLCSYRA